MLKLLSASVLLAASGVEARPNPIRRVVTLLQEMSKEISDEVAKEKKMFEKFQCYCKKNSGSLDAKTKEAAALIKRTKAEAESLTGEKKRLTEEIKKHKKDRKTAKADLEAATKKRAEEKKAYDEATKEQQKTLDDLTRAIAALEKGMGKAPAAKAEGFLQTGATQKMLKKIAASSVVAFDLSSELNSFLQSGADYSSSSGEIVGILKQIKDNINESLGGVVEQEEKAVAAFKEMSASLTELIATSGEQIEKKQEQAGVAAVKIVEAKNKISTTEKQLGDDLATAAELKETCETKVGEFDERQKDAGAEVEAINQAIGVLNDDDALQLFNKVKPAEEAAVALIQLSSRRSPAAAVLDNLVENSSNKAVSLLAFSARQALAAKAGKVDFSKVIKMIDDMAALLKQEGEDDLSTRDSCNESFNESEAERKEVEHALEGLAAGIEQASAAIDQQVTTIKKADDDIKAAKEAMAAASKQRTEENTEFVLAVELNKEAVELIMKAKDKLNAYYNPDLVREVKPEDAAAEEQEAAKAAFVQQPEGAPEIFSGKRENKGQKSGGVLALMDTLANDLNKDTAAMEHTEQTAQRDYEKLSNDLAAQVADSNKARNEAAKTKADTEAEKQTLESTQEMKSEEHQDIQNTIQDLHAKCDFILKTFEERKAARENEIAGLQKAKAVLAGAKFE